MLDAFIIDRIRREREQERARRSHQQPLHIERRPPPPPPVAEREERPAERGSVIVDYRL